MQDTTLGPPAESRARLRGLVRPPDRAAWQRSSLERGPRLGASVLRNWMRSTSPPVSMSIRSSSISSPSNSTTSQPGTARRRRRRSTACTVPADNCGRSRLGPCGDPRRSRALPTLGTGHGRGQRALHLAIGLSRDRSRRIRASPVTRACLGRLPKDIELHRGPNRSRAQWLGIAGRVGTEGSARRPSRRSVSCARRCGGGSDLG